MNEALLNAQQQADAAMAHMQAQFFWWMVVMIGWSILGPIIGFFIARWFLLHVFEIQQKRFFTQLDIFLHQRGIAPHISEFMAPAPAQQSVVRDAPPSPVKTAVRDMAAELDSLIAKGRATPGKAPSTDRTPLERAWEELNSGTKPHPESGEDERYKPKA
jgi:hypothetical protein